MIIPPDQIKKARRRLIAVVLAISFAAVMVVYRWRQVIIQNDLGPDINRVDLDYVQGAAGSAEPSEPEPAGTDDALVAPVESRMNIKASPIGVAAVGEAAARLPAASAPQNPPQDQERDFIARHDRGIQLYRGRVAAIGMKYYKNDPVVREMDRKFASLGRYMALKQRYEKDHNAYQWARDTMALPEVRELINQSMADPRVWRAALGMMTEVLKEPPPQDIHQEATRFMVSKDGLGAYQEEFQGNITRNMGAMIQGAQGIDTSRIQAMAKDLTAAQTNPSR